MAVMLLGSVNVCGQNLATWDVASTGSPVTWAPTLTASSVDPNVTVTSLTRGSGLGTSGTPADYAFGGSGADQATLANAIANNDFFTMTIEANEGYTMSLTGIPTWFTRMSGTGSCVIYVQYSLGGAFADAGSITVTSTSGAGSATPLASFSSDAQTALSNLPSTTTVTLRFVVVSSANRNIYIVMGNATNATNRFVLSGTTAVDGGTQQVVTPAFSPVAGTYYSAQNVEITSATDGASIYYTTDGSTPDDTKTLYTGAITVAADMTIKAIAIKDEMTDSAVAEAVYTIITPVEVSDITAFKALPEGTVATITGAVTVVTQQGSNLFIQDDSEEGWMVVFGTTTNSYTDGDQLTGVTGTASVFNTAPQMTIISALGLPAATQGTPAVAAVLNPGDLTDADINRYVSFESAIIAANITYATTGSAEDGTIENGAATMIIRNHYNLIAGSFTAGEKVDLTGIVNLFSSALRVNLLSIESVPCLVAPTVVIDSSDSDETSIFVTAEVTAEGDCVVTERGFVYSSTNSNPVIDEDGTTQVIVTGADFEALIENLDCGTSFYFRAYAINGAGTSYSTAQTISTAACVVHTVTLNPGTGTVSQTVYEDVTSVELPEATPCGAGWEFAGWASSEIAATTTAPALLLSGVTYHPSADVTLYAVYKRTTGSGIESITIDLASAGGTGNIGNNSYGGNSDATRPERTWIQDGVLFGAKAITANGVNAAAGIPTAGLYIQAQATNGVIYNIDPIPGRIVSITLNQVGTTPRLSSAFGGAARLVTATAGDFNVSGTQVGTASTTGWTVSDFAGTDYNYFAIRRGASAAYFSSIVIEYDASTTTYDTNPNCILPVLETMTVKWSTAEIDQTAKTIRVTINSQATGFGSLSWVETYATVADDETTVTIGGVTLDLNLVTPDLGNGIDYSALGLVKEGTVSDIPVTLTNSAGTVTYYLTITDEFTTALGEGATTAPTLARCFSVTGIQIDCKSQGIVIQQYTDGSVKKELVK